MKPYVSNKLTPKSLNCVFLGYCPATKGYRCLDPVSFKVYTSRHVRFVEDDFPYSSLISNSSNSPNVSSTTQFQVPLTDFSDLTFSVPVTPASLDTPPVSSSAPLVPLNPLLSSSEALPHNTCQSTIPASPIPSSPLPSSTNPILTPTSDTPSTSSLLASSSTSGSSFPPIATSHQIVTQSKNGITKPQHLCYNAILLPSFPQIYAPLHMRHSMFLR